MARAAWVRVGRRLLLVAAVLILLASAYAFLIEPRWVQVTRVDVWLSHLPAALDGVTIAHLSDLHVGPYIGAPDIRRAAQAVNRLSPDLIVVTGDFVSRSARHRVSCTQELATLKSRYGVYAVLGNHDVWLDADEAANALTQCGIGVLRDESRSLAMGDARLWLVGVEDVGLTADFEGSCCDWLRTMWPAKVARVEALLRSIPEDETRILLVHNPDLNEMLGGEKIDLALSGHTHGGQVRLPLLGSLYIPSCFGRKYEAGLVQGPASPVYVNRGLGVITPPARFGCRPEITLLRLRRGQQ
jgi:hypothetical protein